MKIAIIYTYDGSKFSGSQRQPHLLSVEDKLNESLRKVGIFENVISSSRTDKGVHALRQVSSVNCGQFWRGRLSILQKELSRHLAPFIVIKQIKEVSLLFHPRYDAILRSYRYIISHENKSPFLASYVYYHDSIDLNRLNEALKCFIGQKDFKAFYKVGSGEKSTIRNIYEARAYQLFKTKNTKFSYKGDTKPNFTIIKFRANAFLRSQVRLMVANAINASISDENLQKFKKAFTQQKAITKIPAPPNGLYLTKIFYR